ncbi:MAG: hypothetical protein R3C19_14755 [Planctomycetaceae bacterium]
MKSVCSSVSVLFISSLLAVLPHTAADDVASEAERPGSDLSGTRRAMIICGHPGDEQHAGEFTTAIESIHRGLTQHYGFAASDIRVLAGMEIGDSAVLQELKATESTQENIESAAGEFVRSAMAEDTAWVFVLGHSHFDRGRSFFNLPGPDIQQTQFSKLFDDLLCREQVFFITLPASGYYIKPLSKPSRVIFTATEADLEVNGTLFPSVLAEFLAKSPTEAFDIDADGRNTLFDLYINVTTAVARQYLDQELLSTEHANLDDNGDGRGSELQRDWLTEELGGRTGVPRKPQPDSGQDGFLAQSTLLLPPR